MVIRQKCCFRTLSGSINSCVIRPHDIIKQEDLKKIPLCNYILNKPVIIILAAGLTWASIFCLVSRTASIADFLPGFYLAAANTLNDKLIQLWELSRLITAQGVKKNSDQNLHN